MYQSINPIVLWRVSRGEEKQSLHVGSFDLMRILHGVSGLFLLILLTVAFGCGGGGGGRANVPPPSGSTSPSGELLVGITDAEGDFISYLVDVVSLTLHRQNGDTVEVLPLETRIDFSELTEVTELVTVASVPEGQYDSVVIRLDFSDSDIIVQDNDGNPYWNLDRKSVDSHIHPAQIFCR